MNRQVPPWALGATLYMPATRSDLSEVVFGQKLPGLRSLVVCLEDAVSDVDVGSALRNLEQLLTLIDRRGGRTDTCPLLFVRPRDAQMAAVLNDWALMRHVDGFVVPKLRLANLNEWEEAVTNPALLLMPTLETPEVFNPVAMSELGEALKSGLDRRIIALRIGGNDLLGCLGLRRNPATTLYDTPMGYVIPMLAGVMGSLGFSLTAPVCEQLASPELLRRELELDIAHGLVGKTAIHPSQTAVIHEALSVSQDDLESAQLILQDMSPAVFRHNNVMCEPATHWRWAQNIVERAQWYGVQQASDKTHIPSYRQSEKRSGTQPYQSSLITGLG